MVDRTRDAWLVFGVGTAFGLVVLAHYAVNRPAAFGLNYRVYHVAAEAAVAARDFYAVTPADSTFHYLYPPVTVLAFVPSAVADSWVPGYLGATALTVVATALATRLLTDYLAELGHPVSQRDRVLVFGFLLASAHAAPSLAYGQINHLLVAALTAGLVWLARDREWRAGAALAVPAFVKVFPALVGLWLLRRRAWRAIASAVVTAAALTVAGLLAFGLDAYRTYVFGAVLARRDAWAFAGGLDPGTSYVTLRRPLSVAFPAVDPVWYGVGAAALLAPVLAALYWRPTARTDRHVAVHGTLVATLLVVPSYLVYVVYVTPSLIVLLYDLPAGRGRRLFVAGAALANLSVSYGGVREILRAAPVDPATAAAVLSVLRPPLTVATPVLVGCCLMLAGAVVYRVDAGAFDAALRAPAGRD